VRACACVCVCLTASLCSTRVLSVGDGVAPVASSARKQRVDDDNDDDDNNNDDNDDLDDEVARRSRKRRASARAPATARSKASGVAERQWRERVMARARALVERHVVCCGRTRVLTFCCCAVDASMLIRPTTSSLRQAMTNWLSQPRQQRRRRRRQQQQLHSARRRLLLP
jgi:hypothetical protein